MAKNFENIPPNKEEEEQQENIEEPSSGGDSSAMEFLMTYGWAILVVIAAIAALAYFQVLDPARLVPGETITFVYPISAHQNASYDEVQKAGNCIEISFKGPKEIEQSSGLFINPTDKELALNVDCKRGKSNTKQ